MWKESYELGKNPMASKGSPLHGPRIKLTEKAQNLFSETKEHTFEAKAAEEHSKLLRLDIINLSYLPYLIELNNIKNCCLMH